MTANRTTSNGFGTHSIAQAESSSLKCHILLLLALVYLLSGCSEQKSNTSPKEGSLGYHLENNDTFRANWYRVAHQAFKGSYAGDKGLEYIAKSMNSPQLMPTFEEALPVFPQPLSEQVNEAKIERLKQQEVMLQTHLYTLCAHCFAQNLHDAAVVASLNSLAQRFPVIKNSDISAYYASDDEKLLGYSMKSDEHRAYIVFNFSFDLQEVPLPFGFMSSTKVSVWRSDDRNIATFVTQTPLVITPFTAVVIIV